MQEECSRKGMTQEMQNRSGETGEEKLKWQRECITKGTTGVHEADFPIQWHSSPEQLPPSGTGKRPPFRRAGGSRSWGGGQEPPLPPLFPPPLSVALPSPPLSALLHQGCLPGNLSTVGSLQGTWQPRAAGTARSFATPRSQTAFDESSCGTRKISLQYQNPL